MCLSGGWEGGGGPPKALSVLGRAGGGSSSSRLGFFLAWSLSRKCFFLIISAKSVVSWRAGASRGGLELADLCFGLLLLLLLFLSCPALFLVARGERSLSLEGMLLSLLPWLRSLRSLFLPSPPRSRDRSLDLRLLGGVPRLSDSQSSLLLLLVSGDLLGEPALLRRGLPRLLSSGSGVWPPLASGPSGVTDRRLLPRSAGLYLPLDSGLYLLLLL